MKTTMTRAQLLAAEIFGYSFANYQDRLGIGNVRYEKVMPEIAMSLERASRESWPIDKIAAELEVNEQQAEEFLAAYRDAVAVVDAENPAAAFRNAVRSAIRNTLADDPAHEPAIEALVTQICYRAADLAYLLDREGQPLSRYSEDLRSEADDDPADDE